MRPHFHRAEVERPAPERIGLRRRLRRLDVLLVPAPASLQALEARHENCKLERLGQVVVRPGLEAAQHVLRAPARRQHQDRDELPGSAQLRSNGETVLARQHHVEHHDLECMPLFQEQLERLFAVTRHDGLVAFRFEVEAETVGDVLFVFDDEDASSCHWVTAVIAAVRA